MDLEAGRLLARPGRPSGHAKLGLHSLGGENGGERDALLYVPASYDPATPSPLAIMLHGAGGNANHGMDLLHRFSDTSGVILLAPAARDRTWDIIVDEYGPDVTLIDRTLGHLFSHYEIDPERIALGGFSDGASYALSLGITNGDLFTHLIAFSPGFLVPAAQIGSPRVYISHGDDDRVLPIDRCSRRIVPNLKQAGYDVTYHEFAGPHTVPPDVASESIYWFMGD